MKGIKYFHNKSKQLRLGIMHNDIQCAFELWTMTLIITEN